MIGELKGLQILSFQGSDIRKLPIQIGELTALKMLDLSHCEELEQIEPIVLGSLVKLEELNMENSFSDWEIDQEGDPTPSNVRLNELTNRSHLSNVRIHIPTTSMLPKDDQLFSSRSTKYKIILDGVSNWDDHLFSSRLTTYKIMLAGNVLKWDDIADRNESRVLMLLVDSPDVLRLDWIQATLQKTEVLHLSGRLDGKCESIGELCVKGFDCLKELRVTSCPSIRYIISSYCGSLRTLESLLLANLENLDGLPGHENMFSKLKTTKVKDCDKRTHLFDFSLLKCLIQLEENTVEDCDEIQSIVIDEDDKNEDVVTLFKLQKLKLEDLLKFSSFCKQLRTPSKALLTGKKEIFPCLETFVLRGLSELGQIWPHEVLAAQTSFCMLKRVRIHSCPKLLAVFPSTMIEHLQKLEYIQVQHCESMRIIVDKKNSKPTQLKEGI